MMLVFVLNTLMPWRTVALVCLFLPVLTVVALCFVSIIYYVFNAMNFGSISAQIEIRSFRIQLLDDFLLILNFLFFAIYFNFYLHQKRLFLLSLGSRDSTVAAFQEPGFRS